MAGYRARPPSGERPVLALGISDVVVLEAEPRVPVRSHRISAWGKWVRDVAVPVEAPARIAELAARFDIVWASEWGHNAHTAFGAALGLPEEPWPFLPVQFDKLTAIRRYVGDLPWAWVDGPVVDLAEAPDPDDAGGVIVRVDPGVGVVGVDAEELSARVGAAR
jgi:hypothetical protein